MTSFYFSFFETYYSIYIVQNNNIGENITFLKNMFQYLLKSYSIIKT